MRNKRWMMATAFVAVALVCVTMAEGQTLGSVGDVQVGAGLCGDAPMNLMQPYTCVQVTVRCLPAEDRGVQLRITTPRAGTPIRGTLVFGLGGGGRGFYENSQEPGDPTLHAALMLDRLNVAGFRVIQRAWLDRPSGEPGGWINGSTSLERSSCRYATLLTWIHSRPQLHDPTSQAFCAVGQSGGASEIGYALSTFGLDSRLDLAVLTGGPPHGRIDGGCDPSAVAWENACNQSLETLGICPQLGPDQHNCFFQSGTIERSVDAAFDLNQPPDDMPCANADTATLNANSVLSPIADVDHPNTNVVFLDGEDDCGTAPDMGSPYILAVLGNSTGLASFAVVPGVTHTVPAFAAGTAAIEAAIAATDGCVLRH